MNWKKGDKVMWRFENAPGSSVLVPAVVRDVTDKRVTILALLGETVSIRHVKPDRLSARTQNFGELDDV